MTLEFLRLTCDRCERIRFVWFVLFFDVSESLLAWKPGVGPWFER